MDSAKRLPSYDVEFLPLERRLIERRAQDESDLHVTDRRHHERRRVPVLTEPDTVRRNALNG